ncbi:uncharacterized protein ColSpa_03789 [Colletotrichum spaethianum]|uniref:Uncharacterized protein n=1 Tax=Colletotrichum spaethianum TaxID=700344 RepID=A0AA37LC56_9PEZI|nr:uncharacterized protein ColSpa_03789 [Colletotrichum spaethianum]GKT43608.1 hypothetical protein ColSpa_03789 [Colletotrichum spaethianum]
MILPFDPIAPVTTDGDLPTLAMFCVDWSKQTPLFKSRIRSFPWSNCTVATNLPSLGTHPYAQPFISSSILLPFSGYHVAKLHIRDPSPSQETTMTRPWLAMSCTTSRLPSPHAFLAFDSLI